MKSTKKFSKTIITMIILLSLLSTTGCGTSQSTNDSGATAISSEDVVATSKLPELISQEISNAIKETMANAQQALAISKIRIPIILNASGDWVDQNGKIMSAEDVDAFFRYNRSLESEIIYLNWNHCYATNLYSAERQEYLDNYVSVGSAVARDNEKLSSTDLRKIYAGMLKNGNINHNSLFTLGDHFPLNLAADDVKSIRGDLNSTNNGYSIGCSSERTLIRRLYFACLANLTNSGKYAEVCLNDESAAPAIPILLSDDGIWYDQNLNEVDDKTVEAFFAENENQARRIVMLNFTCNPFLTTDNLDSELHKELSSMIPTSFDSVGDYEVCLSALNELVVNLPSQDSFSLLQSTVKGNSTDEYRCEQVCKLAAELENYTSYQRKAMQAYGFQGCSSDLVEYLFIITLAEKVESNNSL